MERPELVWAAWLALTIGTFAYLEARAFAQPESGHTLSAVTRKCLGVYPERAWRPFAAIGFGALLVWLGHHMLADEVIAKGSTEQEGWI